MPIPVSPLPAMLRHEYENHLCALSLVSLSCLNWPGLVQAKLRSDTDTKDVLMINREFFPMNNCESAVQLFAQVFFGARIRTSIEFPEDSSRKTLPINNCVEQYDVPSSSKYSPALVEGPFQHQIREMMSHRFANHHVGAPANDWHGRRVSQYSQPARDLRTKTFQLCKLYV